MIDNILGYFSLETDLETLISIRGRVLLVKSRGLLGLSGCYIADYVVENGQIEPQSLQGLGERLGLFSFNLSS